MADSFKKVRAGDKFKGAISADLYNLLVDMAQRYVREQRGDFHSPPSKGPGDLSLRIQNATPSPGIDLAQYAVVGIGAPLVVPAAADVSFFGATYFASVPPVAGKPFAILQRPATCGTFDLKGNVVSPGDIQPAVVAGMTYALVDVVTVGDGYADAASGNYANLVSYSGWLPDVAFTSTPTVQIIWTESNPPQTGVQWALVRLGVDLPDAAVAGSLIYTLANPIEPFEFSFVSPVTTGGIVNTIMQDFAGCKRVDSLVVGNHGDIADPTNEFNTANTGENPYSVDRVIPWVSIITNGWIVAYNHDERQDDITVGTLGGTIKLGIGTPGNLPENESAAIVYDGQLSVISGFLGFGSQIYQGLENNGVVARGAVLVAGAMNFFLDQANVCALVAGGPLTANTAAGLPRLSIYGQQQTQDSVEITSPVLWDGQWGLILDSLGKPCSVVGANYLGNGQWGFTNYPAYVAGGIVAAQLSGGSGSGSGGGGGGNIFRVSLGTASGNGAGVTSVTATIPNVTVPAGKLLVVQHGFANIGNQSTAIVTFAGTPIPFKQAGPGETSGGITFQNGIDALLVTTTTTGDIVFTLNALTTFTALVLLSAEYVSGLANNAFDKGAGNDGLASTPNSGTTPGTSFAAEYAESAFMLLASSSGTWGGGFGSGGQDVSGVISGTTFVLTEGFEILSVTGNVTATMTGTTTAWNGCVATFD